MIRSVLIKKILKETLFKAFTIANALIPKNDKKIMLYMGNKGLSFNNEALFEYLIEKKYNYKYSIYCSVEGKKYYGEEHDNVKYITHINGLFVFLFSKHVFYTAGQLPIKPSKDQQVIHMQHGVTDYKTMGALTKIDNGNEFYFSHMIATSPIYIPIEAKEYQCPEQCIVVCSEPMVDRLLKPKRIYKYDTFSKVLLWAPTFRKSDYLGYDDSSLEQMLPMFENGDYAELNQKLNDINCLLIVKIHPSQSMNLIEKNKFSNIMIYSHEEFIYKNMNLYDLMASVDGMVGDYSTASLQFLLTGKPIAYVIPDYEEYKEKRGFVFDKPLDFMPGHIIKTKQQFWDFLYDFSNNIDCYEEERKRVRDIIHYYQDGESCKRILEISNINLEDENKT